MSDILGKQAKTAPSGTAFGGGRGGTRTLKTFGQRILSPPRIPIPPLAQTLHPYFYHEKPVGG